MVRMAILIYRYLVQGFFVEYDAASLHVQRDHHLLNDGHHDLACRSVENKNVSAAGGQHILQDADLAALGVHGFRAQQVGEISRNLKIMAKDFGIPIICCAQLNRGTESRPGAGKRPTLADLRDSGSIEQDADIVLFLYRDEYYKDISGGAQNDADAADSANIAEIIVAKNRHGSVKNIKMGWVGQFTKFRTLEDDTKYGN
mgnify:CR=1 FL=1